MPREVIYFPKSHILMVEDCKFVWLFYLQYFLMYDMSASRTHSRTEEGYMLIYLVVIIVIFQWVLTMCLTIALLCYAGYCHHLYYFYYSHFDGKFMRKLRLREIKLPKVRQENLNICLTVQNYIMWPPLPAREPGEIFLEKHTATVNKVKPCYWAGMDFV